MSAYYLAECPHCGSAAQMDDCRTIFRVVCTSSTCGALVLGERAPEPEDGEEYPEGYWERFEQTAADRWNARAFCIESTGEPWAPLGKPYWNTATWTQGGMPFQYKFTAQAPVPAIAPPVAAGSVDTEEFRQLIDAALKSYWEPESHIPPLIANINAWGTQQREAGLQDAMADMKLFFDTKYGLLQRAEKAEAEVEFMKKAGMKEVEQANKVHARNVELEARVKEMEEQAAARLPFKPEPQGIVGNGPNSKEGDRPCWTPDCGTF